MTTGKPPLFDPEENRDYTESEKWNIAYRAADRYYDQKPGVEKNALVAIAVCSSITFLSSIAILMAYWLSKMAN